ncbi:MAG: hypothetical protein V3T05_08090 [Myxococcota bacterium]
MAKRWTKQKAGKQKVKKRAKHGGDSASGGGTMGGMRGFMKSIAGTGGKKKGKSSLDNLVNLLLWGAVVVAGAVFVYRQCG